MDTPRGKTGHHQKANKRQQQFRRGDTAKLQQRIRIIDNKAHPLQSDHRQEQADAGGDSGAKRGRDGADQPAPDPRQREQEEHHRSNKHRGQRLLPGKALAQHKAIGEIGIQPHARGHRHRPFGPQRHDGGADCRCQHRRHETGGKRNAGLSQKHRVHGNDEGHCKEGAEAGKKFTPDSRVGVIKSKKTVHLKSPKTGAARRFQAARPSSTNLKSVVASIAA
ncbi:MAG: Uncharacterised protein [SAR116 cluster bacterium]|nr:MAG: Uncharacterised protein [SAR116 cluster bacterium]